MERLSYFVHNGQICAETFYAPLLQQFLQAFTGESLELTLDTSMLWDQFCLIEVCLIWGGRSISLAQVVLEHGSATVGFEQYRPVLETVQALLPPQSSVTLRKSAGGGFPRRASALADRGFEHGELIRWLRTNNWSWAIRAKCDLQVTLSTGTTKNVEQLLPPAEQAYLFQGVTVLGDIACHLAKAVCWGKLSPSNTPHRQCAECQSSMGGAER